MDVLESLQGALHFGKERGDIYLRLWLEPKDLDRSSCGDSPCSLANRDKDDMNPDCSVKNIAELPTKLSTASRRPSAIRGILRSSDLKGQARETECEVEQDIEEESYNSDSVDAILDIRDSCLADSGRDTPISDVTPSRKDSRGSLSPQKKDHLVSFADQTQTPGTSEKRSLTETRFVEQYMTSDMVYHPSFLSAVVLYVSQFYSSCSCQHASVALVCVLFTVCIVLYLLYW